MFGMCNPEAAGVYGHHPHHQSQHYSNADLVSASPAYCSTASGTIVPTSSESSPAGNGGHSHGHYGLHAAAAAAALASGSPAASSEAASSNNNRSNSVENPTGQHSPTGIISDNGLQYANLDGSGAPVPGSGGYPGGPGGYGHHPMAGYHFSDIHSDGSLAAAAAAAASGGNGAGNAQNFSAYLDNPVSAYAQSQYPSIYGQHHPHSLKSISRGSHDFSPSYSSAADFAAAAAVSKPAPAVPTYKWMHVKRNVPKPGKKNDLFKNFG